MEAGHFMRLYAMRLGEAYQDPAYVAQLLDGMSQDRQDRYHRNRTDKGRLEALLAADLLRRAFALYGIEEGQVTYGYGPNGKPYLESVGGTVGTADGSTAGTAPAIHFNLSHSHGLAVLAISDGEVGVDVEMIGEAKLNVAGRFFTAQEMILLQETSPGDQADLFYGLWTCKEAYMKLTGQGMALAMNSFTCTEDRIGDAYLRRYDQIDGYKLACCSRQNVFADEVIWL